MIVKEYDTYKQRSLNEEELLTCLLPRESFKKKSGILQRSPSRSPTKKSREDSSPSPSPSKKDLELPYAVEVGITRILTKELEFQRKVEQMKQDIFLQQLVDPIELFYNVKGGRYSKSSLRNLDSITRDDLVSFLQEYNGGVTYDTQTIDAIMRRIDKDSDDQIKYVEFLETVSPFHFDKRISLERKEPGMSRSNEKQYFYRTINQAKAEQASLEVLERSHFSPSAKQGNEGNSGYYFSGNVGSPVTDTIKVEESLSPSPSSPTNYRPLRASRSGEKIGQNEELDRSRQNENQRSFNSQQQKLEEIKESEEEEYYYANQTPLSQLKNPPSTYKVKTNLSPKRTLKFSELESRAPQFKQNDESYQGLAHFLKQVLYMAKENEQSKERLLMNKNLNVKELFLYLSQNKAALSVEQLQFICSTTHKIDFSLQEIQQLFGKIREDKGATELYLTDFYNWLTPYNYDYKLLLDESKMRSDSLLSTGISSAKPLKLRSYMNKKTDPFQIDDLMSFLNVSIKNEKLLNLMLHEFLSQSQFSRREELYERIRELFSMPIQPLKLKEFMEYFGSLRMVDADCLLLTYCLPDYI